MHGLGKELKEMTVADLPKLRENIACIREGALGGHNGNTRVAAAYAIRAIEGRIGALMAEGLPTPPREQAIGAEAVVQVIELPLMSTAEAEPSTVLVGATS